MRYPVVAGYFYPSEKNKLESIIKKYLENVNVKATNCVGAIVPHAGYMYSGFIAAHGFASILNLKSAHTVIFLGPNHTGMGSLFSISSEDWETPLGVVKCNKELVEKIKNKFPLAVVDESAHLEEHSIEVQLPFLQIINSQAKIVCISMMETDYKNLVSFGKAIAEIIDKKCVVIASSDFSHYVSEKVARENDALALKLIKNLDSASFFENANKKNWSICGISPIVTLIEFAKSKGVKEGKLIKYSTSAEINRDFSNVVGYASVIFPE